MDAQYPFASREDIWRVYEEVKDLIATQLEHGERIARLERLRQEDARLKSVWGPSSPFPSAVSSAIPQDPPFTPTVEPFKGFDQGHHHTVPNNMTLDNEEEPRRFASRANSVRFDESSMYYGQNRSSSELPIRTGSGLGSHPLTERSLSHRSDGRQSSSGQSHHSARTNSLGLDTARAGSTTNGTAPLPPPPGLFILGPVPCIIRCWLTTNFSNDSLLYAAVCSGSYASIISDRMIQKLGLSGEITEDDGVRSIKMPVYLPEASVYQSSSRAGSPTPHLPALTVRFIVREADPNDKAIQIFIGSDVLRAHNADLLFSQDKMLLVDDERNKISIPLVRPEDDATFRTLVTVPEPSRPEPGDIGGERPEARQHETNGQQAAVEQTSRQTISSPEKSVSAPLSLRTRTSTDSLRSHGKQPRSVTHAEDSEESAADHPPPKSSASEKSFGATSRAENSSVWGPWRREGAKAEPGPYMSAFQKGTRARSMKVLKPSKQISSSRSVSSATAPSSAVEPSGPFRVGDRDSSAAENEPPLHSATPHSAGAKPGDRPWKGKVRSSNPVGGGSAFGWLNSNP